jgi:hypothetical protein
MRRFRDRRWRAHIQESEVNPLEFIANLADAMLILSVGFMLALVANWNIDISTAAHANAKANPGGKTAVTKDALAFDKKDMTKVNDDAQAVKGGDLQKLGTVYYDSAAGKYYILDDKEDGTK